MNRWYLMAAVAGLCSVAPLAAQEGTLAPTAPVVPAPVLQNKNLVTPAGGAGNWGAGSRTFATNKWAPFRNPATAGTTDQVVPTGATSGQPLPPLPVGVSDGSCGAGGCAPAGRGSCWERFKTWVCYHPSKTDIPVLRPTPYITPLQGMYPCTSVGGCGTCATGCASAAPVMYGQPQPQGLPIPMPTPGAGAVGMAPARGTQAVAAKPTAPVRAPVATDPAFAGYRYPAPQNPFGVSPVPGAVVPASLKYPGQR